MYPPSFVAGPQYTNEFLWFTWGFKGNLTLAGRVAPCTPVPLYPCTPPINAGACSHYFAFCLSRMRHVGCPFLAL